MEVENVLNLLDERRKELQGLFHMEVQIRLKEVLLLKKRILSYQRAMEKMEQQKEKAKDICLSCDKKYADCICEKNPVFPELIDLPEIDISIDNEETKIELNKTWRF